MGGVQGELEGTAGGDACGLQMEACTVIVAEPSREVRSLEPQRECPAGVVLRSHECTVVNSGIVGVVVQDGDRRTCGRVAVIDKERVVGVDVQTDNLNGNAALIGGRVYCERVVMRRPVGVICTTIIVNTNIAAGYARLTAHVDAGLRQEGVLNDSG